MFVPCGDSRKSFRTFSLNGVIFSSARGCILQSPFVFLFLMGVWEGLWFVIVALPGLFSYLLFCIPRLLCVCRVETLESLPVHSFNGVIISNARVCILQSPFVFLFLMGVWEGLWFVIVTLSGRFSYLFWIPRMLFLRRVETLESLPVYSINGIIIILSARVCTLQSPFVFLFLMGVWEGLRFVIVALPGLFSYLFFAYHACCVCTVWRL